MKAVEGAGAVQTKKMEVRCGMVNANNANARRGGIDIVTTFLFIAITALIVLYVVFAFVMPNTVTGIKELFAQQGSRNYVALQAVVQECKIWHKSGDLLDVNMPEGIPTDFDNAGLNDPKRTVIPGTSTPISTPICDLETIKKEPNMLGKDPEIIKREFHLECIDKCTALLELYTACGEEAYPPSSDCYKTGEFVMSLRADYGQLNSPVRCAVEGC